MFGPSASGLRYLPLVSRYLLTLVNSVSSRLGGCARRTPSLPGWPAMHCHSIHILANAAQDVVTARSTAVAASPDFLRLPVPASLLESLLAADWLNIEEEEDVFVSLEAWHEFGMVEFLALEVVSPWVMTQDLLPRGRNPW